KAARSHYLRATALQATGSTDDAVKAYQRVLELAPAAAAPMAQLANIYLARNDAKSAVDFLGQVVKKQPRSLIAHVLMGQALLQAGNISAAEAELLPLQKSQPKNAEIQVL